MKARLLAISVLLVSIVLLVLLLSVGGMPATAQGTGTTERVSVASDGTQGNGRSWKPSISADGRYVAFESDANNLVSGDTNCFLGVLVHDRQTGQTTCVSVASDGTQGNGPSTYPAISADGRYVTFYSFASNLVSGDTNECSGMTGGVCPDIFVHDRVAGTTERVSVASDGTQGNGWSGFPSISADGRCVAFHSFASNLVSGDTNDKGDIFVHDRQTGQTTRVSIASDGTQGKGDSGGIGSRPSVSADGRYVAFYSLASNLVSDDTNGRADIFVHDRQTGQTTRVSVASDGAQGNGHSRMPSISADGRYVAFYSAASNLVSDDTNDADDIFVHDRQTGQTTRVSVASDGTQGNGASIDPTISADERYVAFYSHASNLVGGDTNSQADIFIHDRQTGQTTRVSVASDGTEGNGRSDWPSISADGRYVAFDSGASNLVSGDTNDTDDVFVKLALDWREITGKVTDGHDHSLSGVFVGLLKDAESTYAMTTTTNAEGNYVFANIPPATTYKVRAVLRDGSNSAQIHWGTNGLLVSADTQPFSFAAGQTSVTVNIDFNDAALDSEPIPAHDLDDLAVMFYHSQQVNNFVRNTLGEPDFQPTGSVWGFSPTPDVFYSPAEREVNIDASSSQWDDPNRPMNREWHENFHHLMNVTVGMPPFAGGEYNHRGFDNPSSDDSWAEGWAEFWPCVLWDVLGNPNPWLYRFGGIPPSFEDNWQVWDRQVTASLEEFAVASLLWDLYDPKEPVDNDNVDLSLSALWQVIGQATPDNDLTDMRDVYNALWQAALTNEDGTPVTVADIDEAFTAHGFYADLDGDHQWDPGEEVGWAGLGYRRNTPKVQNAYLKVNVEDENGNPVQNSSLLVDVHFDNSYYDYSYTVDLDDATGNMVYFSLPPTRTVVTAELTAIYGVGRSDPYTIENSTYWAEVASSTTGYAGELTFTVGGCGTTYLPIILKNH